MMAEARDMTEKPAPKAEQATAEPQDILRVCPGCETALRLPPEAGEATVKCPACGGLVGPGAAGPVAPPRRKRRTIDSVAGWGASVALHVVILVCLVVIKYSSGRSSRAGAPLERPVSIAMENTPAIEPGDVAPIGLTVAPDELTVPRLARSERLEPIRDVGRSAGPAAKIERIISIDVGSGGDLPAAMKGDWSDLAVGAGGGAGGASFFGLEARGGKFVFVVDRSGSMTGPKLDAAKAELIRAVTALRRGMEFYIIFFDDTHQSLQPVALARATEAGKRGQFAWVRSIRSGAGTNPTSAMTLALSLKPDVIWLLSDGMFNRDVTNVIRRANGRRKTQIHTLAFYSREGERVLKQIADENRGKYRFVSPASIGLGRGRR